LLSHTNYPDEVYVNKRKRLIQIFFLKNLLLKSAVNCFLERIIIYIKILETESVYTMSYFDSEKDYDPWASSYETNVPAYSFGTQPAAPEPSVAAPQADFSAPTTTLAAQPEAPQQAFPAPQPDFSAQQAAFAAQPTAPQQDSPAAPPTFSAPQPAFADEPAAPQQVFPAPQPNFVAPQPAFADPQTIQAKVQNLKWVHFLYKILNLD
jgi:hypothetical protein